MNGKMLDVLFFQRFLGYDCYGGESFVIGIFCKILLFIISEILLWVQQVYLYSIK